MTLLLRQFAPSFSSHLPPNCSFQAVVHVGGLKVTEPTLLPLCILAAIIGLTGFAAIRRTGATGHITYAVSFFLYACMMSSALMIHCFFSSGLTAAASGWALLFAMLDCGLTSSIGLSFAFNGLVDLGVPERWPLFAVMFTSFAGIFLGWGNAMIHAISNPVLMEKTFLILYLGLIAISCGFYGLCQVYLILFRGERKGLGWFFLAMISGFIGILCCYFPPLLTYLCNYLGPRLSPFFSGDFWWFLLSDLAMYSLYRFYLARSTPADSRGYSFQLLPIAPGSL